MEVFTLNWIFVGIFKRSNLKILNTLKQLGEKLQQKIRAFFNILKIIDW